MLVAPCDIVTTKKSKKGWRRNPNKIPTLSQMSRGASCASSKASLVHIEDMTDILDSQFLDLPDFFDLPLVSRAPVSNPNPIITQTLPLKCTFGKPTPWLGPPVLPYVIPTEPALWSHQDTQAVAVGPRPGFIHFLLCLTWSVMSVKLSHFPQFPPCPAQPILMIEGLNLAVALMRVRKLEKAVHLRGILNFAVRKCKRILESVRA